MGNKIITLRPSCPMLSVGKGISHVITIHGGYSSLNISSTAFTMTYL